MASYSKDVRSVFILSVAGLGIGVATQSLLARFLLPEGRGQYAVCMIVFASLLTLICALGQEMANAYYIGAGKLSVSEAMTQSVIIGVLTSLIAYMAGYFLTRSSLSFLNKAPVELFRLSLLCVPPMIFHLYISRIFLGMGEVSIFKYLLVGVQLVALLGFIITGILGILTVRTALTMQIVANGSMALFEILLLRLRHNCRFVMPKMAVLLRSIGYGFRYYFGKLATLVNVQIATIILSFSKLDSEQIGFFAVALALASQILLLPEAIQISMLPRAASDSKGQSRMFAQSTRLCLFCCLCMVLVVFLLSKPIILIFLSSKFMPALIPLWVLLPGILFRTISKVLPAYFSGIDRPQITSGVIVVTLLTNFVLIGLLLPIWGLAGVALANTCAYMLEAFLMALAFRHYSSHSVWDLIRFRREDWHVLIQLVKRFWSLKEAQKVDVTESEDSIF